jgi:Bacterial Ig-like domain (group 3)
VITQAATVTRLALSPAVVRYGGEQAERVSVSVTPRYAGIPGGLVTLMAGKTGLCTIRLSGRKGTCTLAARALEPGRYRLTARYGGNADYSPSRSAAGKLVVLPPQGSTTRYGDHALRPRQVAHTPS